MTPKLAQIINNASETFHDLATDAASKLEEGIAKAAEESQLQEKPARFTFNFKVTLCLDEDKMACDLSFSNKTTLSFESSIPDPEKKGQE